jgi:tetratricopeptide (TPR) repeat protein
LGISVFGLSAPGLVALIRFTAGSDDADKSAAILAPAVILSAAMVMTWVGVNADTERSVARYRAILGYDRTNPGHAYETLARHFEDRFQYTRQIDALRMAYEASPEPHYLLKLGRTCHQNNDTAGATKWFRLYLEARPDDSEARIVFLELLATQRLVDEMIAVSQTGIEQSPTTPEFHFFLGNAYLARGMKEEGLKAFEACSKLDPSPALVQAMRRLTNQAGGGQPDPD